MIKTIKNFAAAGFALVALLGTTAPAKACPGCAVYYGGVALGGALGAYGAGVQGGYIPAPQLPAITYTPPPAGAYTPSLGGPMYTPPAYVPPTVYQKLDDSGAYGPPRPPRETFGQRQNPPVYVPKGPEERQHAKPSRAPRGPGQSGLHNGNRGIPHSTERLCAPDAYGNCW